MTSDMFEIYDESPKWQFYVNVNFIIQKTRKLLVGK